MKRTPLFDNQNKVEQGVVLAHTGKGFDSFFAAIEKLKEGKKSQNNTLASKG